MSDMRPETPIAPPPPDLRRLIAAAARQLWCEAGAPDADVQRMVAEVERLRESLRLWREDAHSARRSIGISVQAALLDAERNAAVAAEVARLRRALSVITATDCYSRDEVTAIARAALEENP